jgi:hypothetical protein
MSTDNVPMLSIDDIISGLSRAMDGASIYPKAINVANEIDPVKEKEAYKMARRFYVMGWDSCIKQIGENLVENGHKLPSPTTEDFDTLYRRLYNREPSTTLGEDGHEVYFGEASLVHTAWWDMRQRKLL